MTNSSPDVHSQSLEIQKRLLMEDDSEIEMDEMQFGAGFIATKTVEMSSLLFAVKKSRYDVAELLLANGFDVNKTVIGAKAPIITATKQRNFRMVDLLLKFKVDISLTDEDGNSALYHAVQRNCCKIAEVLLRRGSAVDDAAIYCAIKNRNLEMMQLLLAFRTGNTVNGGKRSILILAVEQNCYEIVEWLLREGKDVNNRGRAEEAAIVVATKNFNLKICKLLIQHNAIIDSVGKAKKTILQLAVERGAHQFVELFLENNARVNRAAVGGDHPIFYAVAKEDLKICELLVKFGSKVDISNKDQKSLLQVAVETDNFEIVKFLLQNNANVNKTSAGGDTAVFSAVIKENIKIMALLVEFKANINKLNSRGVTPLILAIENSSYACVEFLLKSGASFNSEVNNNRAPIHTACKHGNNKICQLLLTGYGAKINVTDQNGKFPLQMAVEESKYELVEWLLKNYSSEQEDVLHTVPADAVLGRRQMQTLVLKFQSDLAVHEGKDTILHRAAEYRCSLVVRYILNHFKLIQNKFSGLLLGALNDDFHSHRLVKHLVDFGVSNGLNDVVNPKIVAKVIGTGFVDIFQALLTFGFVVNSPVKIDCYKCSFLHVAAKHHQTKIAEQLLIRGAHVSALDSDKKSPILIAVENSVNTYQDPAKIIILLLKYGAYLNDDRCEGSVLQAAVTNRERNLVDIFLKFGANALYRNKDDLTAAHLAVKVGSLYLFEVLLQSCCDSDGAYELMRSLSSYRPSQDPNLNFYSILLQHYDKLKVAQLCELELYLTEFVPVPAIRKYVNVVSNCKTEIAKMKSRKLEDETFSFYDVLSSSLPQLEKFLKNTDFLSLIGATPWQEDYPFYSGIVKYKLTVTETRRKLLDESGRVLRKVLPNLPCLCLAKILKYLTCGELGKLIFAYGFSIDGEFEI